MVSTMSTLCVSVDNLGSALEIGTGAAVRPNHDEPGLKALPRLLDMLDELGIVATFFVEGWNGLHHPDALQSITRRGHDVGLHGWVHAKWATLTDDQREVLLYDGTAALRHAGIDAKGFRAPGDYRGSRTAKALAPNRPTVSSRSGSPIRTCGKRIVDRPHAFVGPNIRRSENDQLRHVRCLFECSVTPLGVSKYGIGPQHDYVATARRPVGRWAGLGPYEVSRRRRHCL